MPDPKPTLFQKLQDWYPLLLLRSQIRIVGREIWLASALVFLLGIFVTLSENGDLPSDLTPLTVLAPIVAVVAIALLYDTNTECLFEIEDASPMGIPLLLLSRMTLIFSFDLLMGIIASTILVIIQDELSLVPVIMSWLIPMTFLSAVAFFTSVLARNSVLGIMAGVGIWVLHIGYRMGEDLNRILYALSMPSLTGSDAGSFYLVISVVLVGLALFISGNIERRIGAE